MVESTRKEIARISAKIAFGSNTHMLTMTIPKMTAPIIARIFPLFKGKRKVRGTLLNRVVKVKYATNMHKYEIPHRINVAQ